MIPLCYALNLGILLTGLLGFRLNTGERRFSLSLVQALLILPLLAGEYLYLRFFPSAGTVGLLLFSEVAFALIWGSLALGLNRATDPGRFSNPRAFLFEILAGIGVATGAGYLFFFGSGVEISNARISFFSYTPAFFAALLVLVTVFYAAWQLERFWQTLGSAQRWEYKFLLVGGYLVCGAMAWSASYRLTYMSLVYQHVVLLSLLMLLGWGAMAYAVGRHRLLNRKFFVSRKVVYSFVVPSLLALYLLGFGVLSLVMSAFGLPWSDVWKGLLLVLGLLAIALFALSATIRRKVQFFISTHFYVNKYEYRDEWLALSRQLQGARTEAEVVNALHHVLSQSLYTREIYIWLGDSVRGYRLVICPDRTRQQTHEYSLAADDPLVAHLWRQAFFHRQEKHPAGAWHAVAQNKQAFLAALNLQLVTPLTIGRRMAGMIGLGSEFTGGRYGPDDFDLLSALGSQTAAALVALRMAERLAHAREKQAWQRLSAFVLHDIKNAATMLALLQENAPAHIHEPEFQQDMLELVDDVLRRMDRVEHRLGTLKAEITPEMGNLNLCQYLADCRLRLRTQLPGLAIQVECQDGIAVHSDPELLFSILENLLINALEAGGKAPEVTIRAAQDKIEGQLVLEVDDNGPGIAEELLPDGLFTPFKTKKEGGSGIGLWQVKRVVESLGGSVAADNRPEGGARFVIRLPLDGGT